MAECGRATAGPGHDRVEADKVTPLVVYLCSEVEASGLDLDRVRI